MKTPKKGSDASLATSILQEVIERQKTDSKLRNPFLSETKSESANLYQDAGGGYNTNLVHPQE